MQGAMLPLGFQAVPPRPCRWGHSWNATWPAPMRGAVPAPAPAWPTPWPARQKVNRAPSWRRSPPTTDFEETTPLLRRNLQRRLASRDLEVESFDLAVDEVTAGRDHHGVAVAALILPDSLSNLGNQRTGPVRKSMTRSAQEAIDAAQRRVDTKAPAARAMRPEAGPISVSEGPHVNDVWLVARCPSCSKCFGAKDVAHRCPHCGHRTPTPMEVVDRSHIRFRTSGEGDPGQHAGGTPR